MKLNLKRLFARSMTGGLELAGSPEPPSARPAKQKMTFVMLAGILAVIGALGGRLLLCDAAGNPADRGRSGQQR